MGGGGGGGGGGNALPFIAPPPLFFPTHIAMNFAGSIENDHYHHEWTVILVSASIDIEDAFMHCKNRVLKTRGKTTYF